MNKSAHANGTYGGEHQRLRDKLAPLVAQGLVDCCELICLMPTRRIEPDQAWDLAHERVTGRYLGPAHATCNRAEGARHRHRNKDNRFSREW